MPPPIDPEDGESLAGLYRECIAAINIDHLEDVGLRHEEDKGHRIRVMCENLLILMRSQGMSAEDFGNLLLLNGLSILAVERFKQSLSSQN